MEFLFIWSRFGRFSTKPSITIGQEIIPPATTACNLGVLFDENLTLKPHVLSLCKSPILQIHCISHIKKFLMASAAKTIVHPIVGSRLNYCNGALAGLLDCDLSKLQSSQNSSMHLISLTKKHNHITSVPMELNWLPIRQQFLILILVIMYKAIYGLALHHISQI